ncbi:MAG: leucine-rich repeat domain-containing protein [Ruminococcus sp.]|nr:leucine-rich repeat domain-containing protein [Ruminococcus sp.]
MKMTLEEAEKEYSFRRKHGKIHIKKYKGEGGKVIIPQYIDEMPVTKIEAWAFSSSDVTEIVISDTIKFIGNSAFICCKLLKKVTFCARTYIESGAFLLSGLEEISGLEYIKDNSLDMSSFTNTPFFEKNDTFIIGDKLLWCRIKSEVYVVPPYIKTIGYLAFRHSKIKEVVLPDGLIEIRNLAFFDSELERINIPDTVKKVGGGAFSCCSLKEIRLPKDFGKNDGWSSYLGLTIPVINDTQVIVDNADDVLIYKDVSCISCHSTAYYGIYHREKQIFPQRLEYLKNAELLSNAFVNVFKNDTFKIGNEKKVFGYNLIFISQYKDGRRRFQFIFDLEDNYAEVLMYFPMMPFRNGKNPHPELIDFYNDCLVNDCEGRFFDFDKYDGYILEQEIPFRIKAEIAYKRCTSNYRLSESAVTGYRNYFQYHIRKLERLLQKQEYGYLKEFFDTFLYVK